MAAICIGPAQHLSSLLAYEKGARAFADTDALRALRTVIDSHPDTVLVDATFASTARGSAFIQRIKGDPALANCSVQLVSCDTASPPPLPVPEVDAGVVTATAPVTATATTPDVSVRVSVDPRVDAASPAPAAPAPPQPAVPGTDLRRAPRFLMVPEAVLVIDGKNVGLVNLSTIGAQVMSTTVLRPRQSVRVVFPKAYPPVPTRTMVVWAEFEITAEGPRYRAGLEFLGGNAATIDRYRETHQV